MTVSQMKSTSVVENASTFGALEICFCDLPRREEARILSIRKRFSLNGACCRLCKGTQDIRGSWWVSIKTKPILSTAAFMSFGKLLYYMNQNHQRDATKHVCVRTWGVWKSSSYLSLGPSFLRFPKAQESPFFDRSRSEDGPWAQTWGCFWVIIVYSDCCYYCFYYHHYYYHSC